MVNTAATRVTSHFSSNYSLPNVHCHSPELQGHLQVIGDCRTCHLHCRTPPPRHNPPPPRSSVLTEGPRQSGLVRRVRRRVVILHPQTSSTGGRWQATGSCATARRAALRGPAQANSDAGLSQHRRPPGGFGLPHVVGHQSAEAVALGRNQPIDPGKLFSIFGFFK
jgi:hypothetical protein